MLCLIIELSGRIEISTNESSAFFKVFHYSTCPCTSIEPSSTFLLSPNLRERQMLDVETTMPKWEKSAPCPRFCAKFRLFVLIWFALSVRFQQALSNFHLLIFGWTMGVGGRQWFVVWWRMAICPWNKMVAIPRIAIVPTGATFTERA